MSPKIKSRPKGRAAKVTEVLTSARVGYERVGAQLKTPIDTFLVVLEGRVIGIEELVAVAAPISGAQNSKGQLVFASSTRLRLHSCVVVDESSNGVVEFIVAGVADEVSCKTKLRILPQKLQFIVSLVSEPEILLVLLGFD